MPSAEWKRFVYLFHCGVNGLTPAPPSEPVDPDALLALADRQAAAGVVAAAMRSATDSELPPETALRLRMEAAQKNLHNRQRMEAALDVIAALEARGFSVTVLKGMSVGVLYRYPECRSSSDTDILIPPGQEKAVLAALEELGFTVQPRPKDGNHDICSHPKAGLFEVHVAFFDKLHGLPLRWDEEEVLSHGRGVETLWDRSFHTLLPQDALRYLVRHLLKHFLLEWTGFKSFYDVALFLAKHRAELDLEAFWQDLSELEAVTLFQTFLSVLVRAGCCSETDFPGLVLQPEALCDRLSEDMAQFDRGFGDRFYQNIPAWHAYLEKRMASLEIEYDDPRDVKARRMRWEAAFPPREKLARRYPVLERHGWLYPVCWLRRAARGVLDKNRRKGLSQLRLETNKDQVLAAEEGRLGRTEILHDMALF